MANNVFSIYSVLIMPKLCLITAMKCGEIHMRIIYHRYMSQEKKRYVNMKGTCHKQDLALVIFKLCIRYG